MNAMLACGGLAKVNCHCQLSKLVGDKFPRTRSLARPVETTRSHDLHPRPASDTAIRNIAGKPTCDLLIRQITHAHMPYIYMMSKLVIQRVPTLPPRRKSRGASYPPAIFEEDVPGSGLSAPRNPNHASLGGFLNNLRERHHDKGQKRQECCSPLEAQFIVH